jgi:carboxypeptidase C (cathepsin A)
MTPLAAALCSSKSQSWAGGSFRRAGPLSFVRIAKAGHMAPMDQPAVSLQLIRQWMAAGQPTVGALRI